MKNIKLISALLVAMLLLTFVSCGNNKAENNSNSNSQNTTENTSTTPTTKEEYQNYLTERYNYYFGDSNLYDNYDIYAEDFTFNGTNEEFLTVYNNSYVELKANLENFKADLNNFVKKGTPEVDKLNAEVITDIDKAILSVDDYTSGFAEKTKDYATLGKDEVVKGLRTIGKSSHDAMDDLKNLIDDAKEKLGIS
ncbi:hypothetical protein [Clostridium disporicum]|uniref:Lioprotein n=1 Tax=Clostridium disporicum TaxID=84024 RepID=A0A174H513_9CLOT|nr:hypothetical protein [Clostridium disporicum]CUO69984.1 lioprotein [Clostridium disporicum]